MKHSLNVAHRAELILIQILGELEKAINEPQRSNILVKDSETDVVHFKLSNLSMVTKFLVTLSRIHRLNIQNTITTKRDVYYEDVILFKKQSTFEHYLGKLTRILEFNSKKLGMVLLFLLIISFNCNHQQRAVFLEI